MYPLLLNCITEPPTGETERAERGYEMEHRTHNLSLQLFADGASAEAGTDAGAQDAASDAGEPTATEESFESLIKGRYKKDFDQRVQTILRERFKANDAKTETLRRDNERLTKAVQGSEDAVRQSFERLTAQAEQAKSVYPGMNLRQELKNPMFTRLVMNGVDAKTAYEVAHRDDILRGGMQFAALRAARQVASAVQANAVRPVENGLGAGAPATVQISDPRQLTRQMRKELRERVRRGEKIYW